MSMSCKPECHVSLGAYGRLPHVEAIRLALSNPPVDPLLGRLHTRHLQLCPQNQGQITAELALQLKQDYPDIQFRLHANVQLEPQPRWVDLCDWPDAQVWFKQMAFISGLLGTSVYTAHAGRRCKASVDQVLRYVREAEQVLGMAVGIEGHYPDRYPPSRYPGRDDRWLISSWAQYQALLESGVHYALDLSHLHILACQSGRIEYGLVSEMLASPCCLEVHLSGNDGSGDQHQPLDCDNPPWWWTLLFTSVHPDAVIFAEGKHQQIAVHKLSSPSTTLLSHSTFLNSGKKLSQMAE